MRPATVVIVDDEPAVRQVLRDLFEDDFLEVIEAESSEHLMAVMRDSQVDLVTLDLNLAADNGLDVLRDLRLASDVGIILVTRKDELVDKVTGLELGADDFITKPFLPREVLARARSVLRRRAVGTNTKLHLTADTAEAAPLDFQFNSWTLSQATLELKHDNGELRGLTTNEFRLLELFVCSPNRVLTRDQIMERLRGIEWTPSDRSIDNYVARLRRKLNVEGSGELIKTVRSYGYQFTATVKQRPSRIMSSDTE